MIFTGRAVAAARWVIFGSFLVLCGVPVVEPSGHDVSMVEAWVVGSQGRGVRTVGVGDRAIALVW